MLVIDDEQKLAEVMAASLQQRGYDVTITSSGSEALYICAHDVFDVIITDLNMPEMDGIQFAGKIRQINPRQRMIVMSAHPEQWTPWNKRIISYNLADEVTRADEIKFLAKPFQLRELLETLESLLQSS